MSKGLIVLVVLVLIVLALFGQYVGVRNQLVAKDQAVKAAWSQVDIVLQRRADLIPNLVETVKGYAQQEVTVFGDIAKARSALLSAQTPSDKIAANGQLDGAIGRLLLIVENYPQLKSNENFLRLQDELAGTENRIAVERKRYNDTLQDYNTYVLQFPNSLYAGLPDSSRTRRTSRLRKLRGGTEGGLWREASGPCSSSGTLSRYRFVGGEPGAPARPRYCWTGGDARRSTV
jgi:LemA protein